MRNKLILMAALGIMLGGCAKDETEPAGTDNILPADGVVRVFPGVDGLQTRAAPRNCKNRVSICISKTQRIYPIVTLMV
ncbi:hypothetical protein [Bacteroides intestinalis]|nr:hypothetical protein [Bacteroides intestinalis]